MTEEWLGDAETGRWGDWETGRLGDWNAKGLVRELGELENGLFLQFSIHFIFVNLWLYKNKTLEVTEEWLGDDETGRQGDKETRRQGDGEIGRMVDVDGFWFLMVKGFR